jgi:long-chain-fatty-acid--CoA ligase ACSBG
MYGRHIFMGYLGLEEKTIETLDSQGYLRTGDIGRMDAEGFLFITGRLKELIITAGGENIPPVSIEDLVKEQLSIVSHAMLIGDKRKFLSILLTLKTEIDLNTGEPLQKLTHSTQEWYAPSYFVVSFFSGQI